MRTPAFSLAPDSEPQDHGTPMSSFDDIPIDPALMLETGDKKTVCVDHSNGMVEQLYQEAPEEQPVQTEQYLQDYLQGPQGDPFAPQPPAIFFPPEIDPQPSQKSMKRKRKSKKEKLCDFCKGDDTRNKDGQPETMLSCADCGRSGHPSCLPPLKAVRSNPWRCGDCKSCEICGSTDNDEDLFFCDGCDRGWHGPCLDPPMHETPDGDWFCSECSQLGLESTHFVQTEYDQVTRAPSVASSSHSQVSQTKSKMVRRRGRPPKLKPLPTEDEEMQVDVETPLRRTRTKSQVQYYGKKGKKPAVGQSDDELVTSFARQPKRMRLRLQSPAQPSVPIPKVRLRLNQKGKGKGKEREDDEVKGLFDDLLGEEERDTSKTTVLLSDKQRFEKSRAIAEEKLVPRPPRFPENFEDEPIPGPSSRPLRSTTLSQIPPFSASSKSPAPSTPGGPITSTTNNPPTLRIRSIRFGAYEIKTWYDAPFPEEYANIPDGRLWICEFCLKYMKSKFGAVRHRMKCKAKHPPGDEIYRDGVVSIFEVDGRKNKIYCQNLCLLSKMYLDHKSLFYDVEPFLFYVMTEVDDVGARFVGYFSKEKRSPKDYNVSCIMTLPVRQRQGWGNLLIDFSYLLSKKEQRTGSPEKPLSALGALGYKNYWTLSLMRYLDTAPEDPRLEDISTATSMTVEDIYNTLVQQNMITSHPATPPPVRPSPGQSIKYIKGRRGGGVARRNLQRTLTNNSEPSPTDDNTIMNSSNDKHHISKEPFIPPKEYEIAWDPELVRGYLEKWESKGYWKLRAEKLKWSPFLIVKSGVGGEVGVVKKTEAKEAVGTGNGGPSAVKLSNRLMRLTTNGPAMEMDRAASAGTSQEGLNTPLSLFDDDNVVNAAEMELPDLSDLGPASVNSALNGRIFTDNGIPATPAALSLDRESPSPVGRKQKTSASSPKQNIAKLDVDVAPEPIPISPPVEPSPRNSEPNSDSDGAVHLNGTEAEVDDKVESGGDVAHSEELEKFNDSVGSAQYPSTPKRKGRPPKKAKKQEGEPANDHEPGAEVRNKQVEDVELSQGRGLRDDVLASGRNASSAANTKRLWGKVLKTPGPIVSPLQQQPFSLVGNEFEQLLTPTKPRQLRNRAVAVASGDTDIPLPGALKRAASLNGRRPTSPRKRKRVESSPEADVEDSVFHRDGHTDGDESEETTVATSLLSLLHSKPLVFDDTIRSRSVDIKEEEHSIPSDATTIAKESPDDEESAEDDGEYDIDDGE